MDRKEIQQIEKRVKRLPEDWKAETSVTRFAERFCKGMDNKGQERMPDSSAEVKRFISH